MLFFTRTIKVSERGMALHGGGPITAGRSPAVVAIMHAPGVDTFMHAIVERLGRAGYFTVAPDLYHRQTGHAPPLEHMKRLKDTEVIADVSATIDYLCEQPEVDADHIGILGFCMGGRIAYLMAAADHRLKAAVCYYGGNIMVAWGEGVSAPYARTSEIACPILFHFGEDDDNPSPGDRVKLDTELTRHGIPHEFHAYPNAGHAFMNFTNAERYREVAAEASWARTTTFLERQLRVTKRAAAQVEF